MIEKYKIIKTIAEVEHLTKSAEQLHMTQSALSHVLKTLEKDWGFSIFHRVKSGMKLTKNGEYILNFINEVIHVNERLMQEVKLINGLNYGQITVGTFPSVTTKWIPKIIKRMNDSYPNISIDLIEDNYETLENLLLKGELDLAFIADKPKSPKLNFEPVYLDPMVCVISREHEITKESFFPISKIIDYPFILPSKGGSVELNNFFKEYGINPVVRYEIMDTNQSIVAMIENNLGISILPELILNELPPSVMKMQLNIGLTRKVGIITTNDLSPATEIFINISKDFITSYKA